MKKAIAKRKVRRATFMYVPESGSSVKSLRMPLWLPAAVVTAVVGLIFLSVVCIAAISDLKIQYQTGQTQIEALTQINDMQKTEIQKLEQSTLDVQKQLDENVKALTEIKEAVGIKDSTDTKKDAAITPAASTTTSPQSEANPMSSYKTSSLDMSTELSRLNTAFVSLTNQLSSQKQEIEKSTKEIKGKLTYLRAKPSIVPVQAAISCNFGYRSNPFTSRGSEFHPGIDFAASYGTKVAATGDGVVIFAGWNAGYGKMVIISHGYGITTAYGHNSKLLVKQGDHVKKGQAISQVGNTGRSTGTHLHYEVKVNGINVNPAKYF